VRHDTRARQALRLHGTRQVLAAVQPGVSAEQDRQKFEELFAQQRFSVPAMGPLLVHAEYTGKDLTAEELKLVCGGCGKRDAPKVCSACSRARYCSVECQKGAWREHKSACKRLTEAELADLAKPTQNHESLTATD
jgi:hypothetical protein